jgi:hypothetical protein
MLFVGIPKIEIKITHRGLTCLANGPDILNNCGTGRQYQQQLTEIVE